MYPRNLRNPRLNNCFGLGRSRFELFGCIAELKALAELNQERTADIPGRDIYNRSHLSRQRTVRQLADPDLFSNFQIRDAFPS